MCMYLHGKKNIETQKHHGWCNCCGHRLYYCNGFDFHNIVVSAAPLFTALQQPIKYKSAVLFVDHYKLNICRLFQAKGNRKKQVLLYYPIIGIMILYLEEDNLSIHCINLKTTNPMIVKSFQRISDVDRWIVRKRCTKSPEKSCCLPVSRTLCVFLAPFNNRSIV